jgi:hypothetical protein
MCECADPNCPFHRGESECSKPVELQLFRSDMQDESGTLFCADCGTDALNSGLFSTEEEKGA